MAEYFVERQYWTHWPKTLLMCRKHGEGIEHRRYVPDKGTCKVESSQLNEYGHAPQASDYTFELSCGHSVTWDDQPDYCPWRGRRVVG